jgi:hypothetical protein
MFLSLSLSLRPTLVVFMTVVLASCGDGCVPPSQGEGEGESIAEGEGEGNAEGEGEGSAEGEGEPPPMCVRTGCDDCDRDGFYTCIDPAFPARPQVLDCNDDAFSAQPGGAEFAGNTIDDDCDQLIDEAEDCPCGDDGSAEAVADAIGGCGQRQRATTLGAAGQRQVGTSYFGVEPRNGGCMLTSSTGVVDFTNPASWPLQPDSAMPVRSRALDVHFSVVGPSVRCTLEDGTTIDPCSSPLRIADLDVDSGPHVLSIAAIDEEGNVQEAPALVPIFVGDETPTTLLWPDGDVVGSRPRLVGQGQSGIALSLTVERDGQSQVVIPTVDDAGVWSLDGSEFSPALGAGEWTLLEGDRNIASFTVETDASNGPPVSTVTSAGGAATITSSRADELVCVLDGEPFTCRRGGNNLMTTPGIHVLTVEAFDIEAVAEVVPRTFFVRVPGSTTPALTHPSAPTGSSAQPVIAGNASQFGSISVAVDGTLLGQAQLFGSTAVANALGQWSVPPELVPVLTPGSHTISVSIDFNEPTNFNYVYDPAALTPADAFVFVQGPLTFAGQDSSTVGVVSSHPVTGATINDVVGLRLQLQVPRNARGMAVDAMFVSSEWPEFLCSDFNDSLDIYLVSNLSAGQPSNIALDPDRDALTVNNGYFELPTEWTEDLGDLLQAESVDDGFGAQCGFPIDDTCMLPDYCADDPAALSFRGSGTGWLIAQGPVEPGETIDVLFLVADVGDSSLDSLMLLSGLRWLPEPPPSGVLKPE